MDRYEAAKVELAKRNIIKELARQEAEKEDMVSLSDKELEKIIAEGEKRYNQKDCRHGGPTDWTDWRAGYPRGTYRQNDR